MGAIVSRVSDGVTRSIRRSFVRGARQPHPYSGFHWLKTVYGGQGYDQGSYSNKTNPKELASVAGFLKYEYPASSW